MTHKECCGGNGQAGRTHENLKVSISSLDRASFNLKRLSDQADGYSVLGYNQQETLNSSRALNELAHNDSFKCEFDERELVSTAL